ncbi:hypothetical protein [Bartonella sp. CM120XJJH]|uniref:hypothetical protein n=1 Tax=Bartonella sp. CM120XJJH TaxID=3243544 RepID=UPI0035CFB3A5
MSWNEILWIAVVSVLLLSGVMFRIALHYRDQVKALKEQVNNLKKEMRGNEFRYLKETKQTIDECDADLKERDKLIEALKQEIKERYEEMEERDEEIKERDKLIKKFKQQTEEHEKAFRNVSEVVMTLKADVQSRDTEIQRLTQELKQRDEAVKAPSHKNKKSKKKGK